MTRTPLSMAQIWLEPELNFWLPVRSPAWSAAAPQKMQIGCIFRLLI
jgi:hypothetical protein